MVQEKRIVEELLGAVALMQSQTAPNPAIAESLANVQAMLAREDRGWELFSGGGKPEEGLSLDDLKAWSKKLSEYAVASPLGKRGLNLQYAFVWRGGIKHSGIPKDGSGKSPRVNEKIKHPVNQRNFFGKGARKKRQGCLYHDGIALWIGEDSTKLLYPIPLEQITGYMTDPDFPGVIWAYRRSWTQRQQNGENKQMVRWYFVDHFKDKATSNIKWMDSADPEEVDQKFTAFDMHPNAVEGWPLGIPDALAAWIWADIVKGLYLDGVDVSSAMATLAFKVNSNTAKASQNAAVQFASAQGAGGTAVMGMGSDLSVLASAGKGYDFSHIRSVIAMVATSLDVSTIALTSNTADAGSSYGSAATLDEPGRLTMSTRRDENVELEERVLRWMGAPDAVAYFEPYDDGTEVYRRLQAVTLPWLQGVLDDETYKGLVAGVLGVPDLGTTPEGLLLPNNRDSLGRSDIDTDGQPTGSTGSPTQGRSSGDGGGGSARDARDDTIT